MTKKKTPPLLVAGRYVEVASVLANAGGGRTNQVPVLRDLKLRLENEKQKRKTRERYERKNFERQLQMAPVEEPVLHFVNARKGAEG